VVPPSRPFASTVRSLPVQAFTGFDTVYAINAALFQLERGVFRNAAILSDATGRDDRISAVTSTRVGGLLATNLDVKPADDTDKAAKLAGMLGGTEDAPGRWDRMFPQGNLAKLLRSGLHLNMGVAQIVWTLEGGMWWPRLHFWHSQFVRWDVPSESFKLQTENQGEIDLPRLDDDTEAEGNWFVWCPFGYRYAWTDGLIRSLAPMFMRRMWINRDWARYNEVHGLPITKAIAPGSGGKGSAHEEFFEAVANRGAEPTILLRQGEDGNKFDVELLEATAQTYQTFSDSKTDVNTDIAILMLGQNLTTEATGGGLGDGGAATHNLVRLDKAREDAALATELYKQVLRPWARFNFKDPNLAPRPMYRVDPPDDEISKAAVLKGLGDGIAALAVAKVPINIRSTAEEFGLLLVSEEEQAALEAVAKEEAAAKLAALPPIPPGGAPGAGGAAGGEGGAPPENKPAALSAGDLAARPIVNRYQFQGLPIAVEHARGTTRTFHDGTGAKTGESLMLNDYGFIEGAAGSDGQDLDCYVGPNEDAKNVHVVHQLAAPDYVKRDEDKVMLGFSRLDAAQTAFIGNRPDGAKAFGGMSVIPVDVFKAKLARRKSSGKIRASAGPDVTFEAIMAMADGGVAALRARTVGKVRTVGAKKSKRYPDQLTERAVALGARALAADLKGVKGEIAGATTFADLEKRLVRYYRDKMDSAKLARLIQRTRLMANLTGRLTVAKGA
jgi:phage gp29-like protein